jgi:hypothetical protein
MEAVAAGFTCDERVTSSVRRLTRRNPHFDAAVAARNFRRTRRSRPHGVRVKVTDIPKRVNTREH